MIPFVRSYLVIDDATSTCAAVDPAQPAKALAAAEAAGVAITVVLTTHKHWDHSGGNVELAGAIPGLTVVGGAIDEVDGCTLFVGDGQVLQLGSISVTCLLTPGHTKGHITYFCHHAPSDARHVFTGDVMFVGGCGKFFEGTAAEMHPSLYEKIGTLPDDTLVWPGHEVRVKRKPYTKYSCSSSKVPRLCSCAEAVAVDSIVVTLRCIVCACVFISTRSRTWRLRCARRRATPRWLPRRSGRQRSAQQGSSRCRPLWAASGCTTCFCAATARKCAPRAPCRKVPP